VNPTNAGNYTVAITNVAGAVTSSVAAVNIALPPSLTTSAGTPGAIQLSATTVTGLTYIVEATTNLVAPAWLPLQTNNTGVSGAINFQTNTTSGPNTFFRLIFP
jgi:hypothetical protein